MKIAIVMGAFLPVPPLMGGAVEKVWFALAQEFARRGHNVVQISRAVPELPRTETIAGVQHIRVAGFDAPASLAWLKVLDLIYSVRARFALPVADVIVTNTFWLPMLLRRSRGLLYVHVARFPKGQMRFYRHASRLQTVSSAVAEAIKTEAPSLKEKIAVIANPVATTGGQPGSITKREKIIMYAGRLHPEKGVHLLVAAFGRIAAEYDEWKLVLVGPWESKFGGGGAAYRDVLEELSQQCPGRVELRAPVFEPGVLEEQLRSARLFVYPSLAEKGETFGLAPLEAMAQGCAVLVSQLACFLDFIRGGETGFVFNHRAPDPVVALQASLAGLLTNEALLAQVAEAAYRKSLEFSVERVADRYLQDFGDLTQQSHG